MQLAHASPGKKIALLVACLLIAAAYVAECLSEFAAAHLSEQGDLVSLQRSTRLQPGNAQYQYLLGRYYSLVEHAPETSIRYLQSAVSLNPHSARYWFALASQFQLLNQSDEQRAALERAVTADPKTPEIAWEAANLYLVQGDTDKALREFRAVVENDPSLAMPALRLCLRANPDVDSILRIVVPPDPQAHFAFLDLLIAQQDTAGAAKVWNHLAQINQHFPTQRIFDYFRYLILKQDVDQAELVWRQASSLCGLSGYQPTSKNLVVNGDFSLDILNGGFDWFYQKLPEVKLALDPTQHHSGSHSLSISFDSRSLEDAGLHQFIPVEPDTAYEFSGYFKAENILGAGGPEFSLQDVYKGTTFFESDPLKDADYWKPVSGEFTTGPDTRLLLLRIRRVPADRPIKGKLWIDGIRLVPKK